MTDTNVVGIERFRKQLAEIVHRVSIEGETIYVTKNGRKVCAMVPLADAAAQQGDIRS
jgi:prevent-host-death family protein